MGRQRTKINNKLGGWGKSDVLLMFFELIHASMCLCRKVRPRKQRLGLKSRTVTIYLHMCYLPLVYVVLEGKIASCLHVSFVVVPGLDPDTTGLAGWP